MININNKEAILYRKEEKLPIYDDKYLELKKIKHEMDFKIDKDELITLPFKVEEFIFGENDRVKLVNSIREKNILSLLNIMKIGKNNVGNKLNIENLEFMPKYYDPMAYFFEYLDKLGNKNGLELTPQNIPEIREEIEKIFSLNKDILLEKQDVLVKMIDIESEKIKQLNETTEVLLAEINEKTLSLNILGKGSITKIIVGYLKKNKFKEIDILNDEYLDEIKKLKEAYRLATVLRSAYSYNQNGLMNIYYMKDYTEDDIKELIKNSSTYGLENFKDVLEIKNQNELAEISLYEKHNNLIQKMSKMKLPSLDKQIESSIRNLEVNEKNYKMNRDFQTIANNWSSSTSLLKQYLMKIENSVELLKNKNNILSEYVLNKIIKGKDILEEEIFDNFFSKSKILKLPFNNERKNIFVNKLIKDSKRSVPEIIDFFEEFKVRLGIGGLYEEPIFKNTYHKYEKDLIDLCISKDELVLYKIDLTEKALKAIKKEIIAGFISYVDIEKNNSKIPFSYKNSGHGPKIYIKERSGGKEHFNSILRIVSKVIELNTEEGNGNKVKSFLNRVFDNTENEVFLNYEGKGQNGRYYKEGFFKEIVKQGLYLESQELNLKIKFAEQEAEKASVGIVKASIKRKKI